MQNRDLMWTLRKRPQLKEVVTDRPCFKKDEGTCMLIFKILRQKKEEKPPEPRGPQFESS